MKHMTFVFCTLFAVQCYANEPFRCKLLGEVKGVKTEAIWLKKVSESIHLVIENENRRIPVKDGVFEHEFTADEIEAYEFVFDEDLGSTWGLIFFPDEGLIRMVIHRWGTRTKLIYEGGKQNDQYANYKFELSLPFAKRENELIAIQESLLEVDEYDSEEFKATRSELKLAGDNEEKKAVVYRRRDQMEKTGKRYSDKGWQFKLSWDSLMTAKAQWTFEYAMKNRNPMSYFLLYQMAKFAKSGSAEITLVNRAYPFFAEEFPEHSYTNILGEQLSGLSFTSPGYKYTDVEAKTLDGKSVKISTVLNGKINLINLWGSWCGPCIVKGRKIVPLHAQYKEKGFEIVGIAREFKDTKALKSRLSKEQFSWLNLVELDDENKIWTKYGIGNGAGLMVLTDHAGLIIAVDPTPEEIENILKEKL